MGRCTLTTLSFPAPCSIAWSQGCRGLLIYLHDFSNPRSLSEHQVLIRCWSLFYSMHCSCCLILLILCKALWTATLVWNVINKVLLTYLLTYLHSKICIIAILFNNLAFHCLVVLNDQLDNVIVPYIQLLKWKWK